MTSGQPIEGSSVTASRRFTIPAAAWICLSLFLATVALYWPVHTFPLNGIDDPEYVTNDANVKAGFTATAIRGAFVATGGNWIPLTHMSHMLDYNLYGDAWGYHHVTSVILHGIAVVLLFLFLSRATGALWPSAFLAAVFAVHPLHVESVAWVAERKDVLCALFWFLALLLWVRYLERPGVGRYVAVLVALLLGIWSKPMIVSFPVLLLILDFWPFRRPWSWRLLLEKVPAVLLVVVCSVVTYQAQDRLGAVQSLDFYPMSLRVQNALASLLHYQWDLFWPSRLAFGYPYPAKIPWSESLAALILLAAVTGAVFAFRRSRPWLLAGWLWYLLTIFPVIGLVMVGSASRADRYMYVPSVGISIMVIWLLRELMSKWPQIRIAGLLLAASVCGVLAVTARTQIALWSDNERLYRHSMAVVPDNYVAMGYLGLLIYPFPERAQEGLTIAREIIRLRPEFPQFYENLSLLALQTGRLDEACAAGDGATRAAPGDAEAWFIAGKAYKAADKLPEAKERAEKSLSLEPNHVSAHYLLATILLSEGNQDEAIRHLNLVLRRDPVEAGAQAMLGALYLKNSGPEKALPYLEEAVRLRPDMWEAQYNLGLALINNRYRQFDAISHLEESLRIKPDNAGAHRAMGTLLIRVPDRKNQAIAHFEVSLRLQPDPALQRELDKLKNNR